VLLPGARESLNSIRELNGKIVVVSAKKADFVQRVLDVVGLEADAIHGYLFAEKKGVVLLEENALVYVGDHPGDIRAARAANAISVVVPTGPTSVEDLQDAGPDKVLASLEDFPDWLKTNYEKLIN
jgi:phosphoglycolate phosphatase